jgi:glycosyltransferase involved in cell wall biosynthesis
MGADISIFDEVHFVLPGYSRRVFGGYKIVYEHAEYIRKKTGAHVFIHHSGMFIAAFKQKSSSRVLIRSVMSECAFWIDRILRRQTYRHVFFGGVKSSIFLPNLVFRHRALLIATSVHTAPFVEKISSRPRELFGEVKGYYFIQSFESWSAPLEAVENTWQLDLDLIVISGALQAIAATSGRSATLVPNGIDFETFSMGGRISARPMTVAALVSDLPVKRTDVLIEVFSIMIKAVPEINLIVFGTCERPKGLPSAVKYFKNATQERVVDILQNSRVYICVSDVEGWALPPAEAMSCGAALVTTDIDGVLTYADGACLSCPSGDAAALAAAAVRLLLDDKLNQEIADKGTARIHGYGKTKSNNLFLNALMSHSSSVL